MKKYCAFLLLWSVFTAACSAIPKPAVTTPTETVVMTLTSSPEAQPTKTATPLSIPTRTTRLDPEQWQEWPVIPQILPSMKDTYQQGILKGNAPAAFTKIGDGEISTIWFLTHYDLAPSSYKLGEYTNLQSVIDTFSGSFSHVSLAADRGFNTTIILGAAPPELSQCVSGESRLDCELRIYNPSIAFVSMGTNQIWQPQIFESEMRQVIELLLNNKVVPILATKADNLEGNHQINRIIVRLAYEYEVPLWNYWLAVQPLPDHGLQPDQEHLTYAYSNFDDPVAMENAWPRRNLTALQALDAVYQAVTSQP